MMPHQCTIVPLMRPAPTMPPIRACEEDEGRPNHQVIKVPDTGAEQGGQDDDEALLLHLRQGRLGVVGN